MCFNIPTRALQAHAISDKHLVLSPFPLRDKKLNHQEFRWDVKICQINSIRGAPDVNKFNKKLRLINESPGLNKTDDHGCNFQRHYRSIIQAHYFTSVLNATHSDNFMKVARFKSMKYAWSSHHSLHNEYAYLGIDTFALEKYTHTLWS